MSSLLRFWRNVRQVTAPRHTPPRCRSATRFRPQLHPLEDRLVPANLTWSGSNSELWSDPGNWVQGKTPYMTAEPDALVFDEHASRKTSNHDGPATAIESIAFFDSGYTITGGDLTLDHYGIHSFVGFNRRGINTVENRTLSTSEESLELRTTFAHEDLVVRSNITGGRLLVNLDFQGLGEGRLSLLGNNSYTGGTNLFGGTLVVGNNSAVGSGRLELSAGTLEASASLTLPNPITVRGTTAIGGTERLNVSGSVEILGAGYLKIANTSGPVRFSGGLTGTGVAGIEIQQNATLTVANAPGVVSDFSGYIYGPGSLRKEGNGQLTLGSVGHYTGGTEIAAGVLLVTNDRALGFGTVTLSGGTLTKDVTSAVTLANPWVNTGGTIRNSGQFPFTFTGPGTLHPGFNRALTVFNDISGVAAFPAEIIFTGAISGAGRLTVVGGGITTFAGTAANSYSGITTVEEGILVLRKPDHINAIAGPLVVGRLEGAPAVVSLGAPNQIADDASVTLTVSGLLEMNNFDDLVGSIDGDGQVQTGDPPTLSVGFNDRSTTFGGVIRGPGTVVKVGAGAWTLTGNNAYTGGTVLNGGTLLVNGSVGAVTINAGATLGGTGATGPVTLAEGAAISPAGADAGILRVQDLAFSAGSSYVVQLNGPNPGADYDQLDVAGSVSLNGATLSASLGFSPAPGDTFVIIQNDGADPVAGAFAGLPQGAPVEIGGVAFHIHYNAGDGNDVELVRNFPPEVTVPGDQTAFQNVDLLVGNISVGDPDDPNLTVTLQVSHGTLTLGTANGLTVGGNRTSTVTLSGSQADLNAALAGLLYRGDLNYSGPDMLSVAVSDGFEIASATVAIRVRSLAEQAADLQAQVAALWSAGALNKGQANSLLTKLDLKDNQGDIGRVQALLNEVDALVQAGILSPAQADALRGPGNILLTGLRRR